MFGALWTQPASYVAIEGKGCKEYIHMDSKDSYGVQGGKTTLEECAAAVARLNGQEGCNGDYFFYESAGYCNCPRGDCNMLENKNAGSPGQLYKSTSFLSFDDLDLTPPALTEPFDARMGQGLITHWGQWHINGSGGDKQMFDKQLFDKQLFVGWQLSGMPNGFGSAHDASKCSDWSEDCCASDVWGEPQTCKDGYVARSTSAAECPSSWEACAMHQGGIGCYGCYPPDSTPSHAEPSCVATLKCHPEYKFCVGYEEDTGHVYCYGWADGCKWDQVTDQNDCATDADCAKYTTSSPKYTDSTTCPGSEGWRAAACECHTAAESAEAAALEKEKVDTESTDRQSAYTHYLDKPVYGKLAKVSGYVKFLHSAPSASSGFGFKLLGQVRNEWVTGMTPNEWHWVSVSAAVAQGAEPKGESGLVFDSAWPEPIQFGALKLEIFDQLPLSRLRPVTLEEGVRQWKDSSAVLVNVPRHLLGAKLYQFPTRMYGAFSIQLAAGADGRCPPRQLHVAFHPGRDGGLEAFFRNSTGWNVTKGMAWMAPGGARVLTGTPSFVVNWLSFTGDILFHFNPRIAENEIVMNTKAHGGCWGKEERIQLDTGRASATWHVAVDETGFSVLVGGKEKHLFRHRLPWVTFSHVQSSSTSQGQADGGNVTVQLWSPPPPWEGEGAVTGPMSYASTQLLECPSQQAPVTFAFPPATQERLMSVFISANASTASPQGTVTDDLVTVLIEDECSKALDAERYIF